MANSLNRWSCFVVLLLMGAGMPLAQADTPYVPNGPKPLQLDTPSTDHAAAPTKKGELPKEYVDMRNRVQDEFNAWLKDDNAIRKECEYPTSPTMRFQCDKKKEASQARLDTVHAHTRIMLRKTENWRRKQVGMPTLEAEEAARARGAEATAPNPGANGAPARPKPPPPTPILLPQDDKPLPAGTF